MDRTKELALSFVRKHGLWSAEHIEAANRLRRIPEDKGLRTIQFSLPDQHGLLRGKTQIGGEALSLIEGGCSATTTLLAGYITSYRVSPLRGWRRLWYEADKGRWRPRDGSRPDHVQGAALRRPGGCRAICTSPNRCPVPFATRGLYRRFSNSSVSAAIGSRQASRSNAISSSWKIRGLRRPMPAIRARRPLSACCRRAINI